VVHWARLLDLPLALLMLPFIKIMGMQNAALLASFIVPPATFGLLLWLAAALARIFVGADRANLSAPLVLFAPLVVMNFVPGRVDHHGYEILVAGFGLLCLERMAAGGRRKNLYAVGAAIALACGLWIGTEALPWVILFVGCLEVMAAWQGGDLLRRAAVFGLCFTAATLVVLPLAVAPAEYSSLALSWYSAADVVLAALVAAMFAGAWLAGRATPHRSLRLLIMAALGLAAAAAFFALVPGAAQGPFADYDDFDSTIALANIGEAQPLAASLRVDFHNLSQTGGALVSFSRTLFLPLAGFLALCLATFRADPRRRPMLFAYGAFFGASILLTLFWQMRVGWFMQFFAVAPLTYLLVAGWERVGKHATGRARFWLEVAVFLALGFAPTVLVPALAGDAPFWSDVVLFPAARPAPGCPLRAAADFLNQPWGYGAATHTVMSGGDEGPELLFRTRQNVIAANFNVAGNRDAYDFFGARDDDAARAILRRWHADLVLVCRNFPLAYARLDHARLGKTAFLSPAADGKLYLVSNPEHPTLIERLIRGPVPVWLKPVEIPGDKDYLLFEARGSGFGGQGSGKP
jgi:hypothetical protein